MQKENLQFKSVTIIGAGLSGLTAANTILEKSPKTQVTIIQAMDAVGGRTHSVKLQGAYYDLGAQWIGPNQKYVRQLANKSGNQLLPQFCEGKKVMQFGNKIQTYSSDIPTNVGVLGLIELQKILWKLQGMIKQVALDDPMSCPKAIAWDSITFAGWLHQNIWQQRVKILFQLCCRSAIGCQANQISFLFFLWYVHMNTTLQAFINIKNGLQQTKMKYGTQHMSHYLRKEIQAKGGKIHLSTFVNVIQNGEQKCTIKTLCGRKFESDYVIVAIPPCNVKKIKFLPDLPVERKNFFSKNMFGTNNKEPYWRNNGYSGQGFSDGFEAPILFCFDDARPKQNGETQYAITLFLCGSFARQWLSKLNWKQKITQQLAKIYKCQEMLNPIQIVHKNWEQQPSIEGVVWYLPTGVMCQMGDLKEPNGRVHWAGTELADISQGYMDGAIQSGLRVADQIVERAAGNQNYYKRKVKKQKSEQQSTFRYTQLIRNFKI